MKYLILFLLVSLPAYAAGDMCKTEYHFSPNQGAEQTVVEVINNAKSVIHIEAYQLTSQPILKALNSAKDRGLEIKAVLDKTNRNKFFGFETKIAPYKIFHDKVLLVDGKILITGSYNWTKNAQWFNAENFVILSDCDAVQAYEVQFQKYWSESK